MILQMGQKAEEMGEKKDSHNEHRSSVHNYTSPRRETLSQNDPVPYTGSN